MGLFDRFANWSGSASDKIGGIRPVNASNPVRIVGLFTTIIGAFYLTFIAGLQSIQSGLAEAFQMPISGGTGFVVRFVTDLGGWAMASAAVGWHGVRQFFAAAGFSWAAWPFAVMVVLLTLYVSRYALALVLPGVLGQ